MRQNHVVILLIVLMLGGVIVAGVSSIQNLKNVSLAPTPTPDLSLFNNPTVTQMPSAPQLTPQSQPTQKVIKQYSKFPGILTPEQLSNKGVIIQTDKGNIGFGIYPEATMAASNFLILASNGFYDGLTFHRVDPGFVIQGGDPLGNGRGGPGYTFGDEPVHRSYVKGTVAMANAGPNTNGSQFFIMLSDHPEMPPKYTIFGQVVMGLDVIEKIQVGDVMRKVLIVPLQ